MTKPIMFKAWDKHNKRWEIVQPCWIMNEQTGAFTLIFDIENDDYELLQYIGREDKNGKPIFEGDVIKYLDNTSQGLVEKTTVITDIRYLPDFGCSKWEEVIGNCWDSPELLESGEA